MSNEILKGHLRFVEEEIDRKGTKGHWVILNRKDNSILGDIAWYKKWHKHVAYFRENSIFDKGCLLVIFEILEKLDAAER